MASLSLKEQKRIARAMKRQPPCCLCGQPGWHAVLWVDPAHAEREGHCYSLCYSCSIRDHREELNARSARLDAHRDLKGEIPNALYI